MIWRWRSRCAHVSAMLFSTCFKASSMPAIQRIRSSVVPPQRMSAGAFYGVLLGTAGAGPTAQMWRTRTVGGNSGARTRPIPFARLAVQCVRRHRGHQAPELGVTKAKSPRIRAWGSLAADAATGQFSYPDSSESASAFRNESRPLGLVSVHPMEENHGSRNFALALGRADSDHHPARADLALGGCDGVHITFDSPARSTVAVVTGTEEVTKSAVSWAAIFAGAAAAAATTLILLVLGTGIGLSVISPWYGAGASAMTVGVSAIIWLVVVQWLSSALGGFIAGSAADKVGGFTHSRSQLSGHRPWLPGLVPRQRGWGRDVGVNNGVRCQRACERRGNRGRRRSLRRGAGWRSKRRGKRRIGSVGILRRYDVSIDESGRCDEG